MDTHEDKSRFRGLLRLLGVESDNSSLLEKLISGIGGFVGIYLILLINQRIVGHTDAPLIVASMGASAVLLFAAPHGKFSQPWNLIGGHGIAAAIGVACAQLIPDQFAAAALAVGISISVMYALRCIHPPGGASALMAVIGGNPIHALGYTYVLAPVLLNALVILAAAVSVNALFAWRRYPAGLPHWASGRTPHAAPAPETVRTQHLEHGDLEFALRKIGSYIDVTEDDLETIFELAQAHARLERLPVEALRLGHYYSNGEYGSDWAVRRIIDEAAENHSDQGLVIYKIIAGTARNTTGTCTRAEFANWARYEVVRIESSWQRADRSA
jgi:CBS domain-containing membrane protein